MITYHKLLAEGRERLAASGAGEQATILLLNELCAQKKINLYMEMEQHPDAEIATDYLEGIHRMELGEPLGYVLGYENFYGYNFNVNPDVLIPRPETEELVANVLAYADERYAGLEHPMVFDVACGSGAIGITLSLEEDRFDVIGSDISQEALQTAIKNNNNLHGRVSFVCGDMLMPFIERDLHCDILVCNPPYIPAQEQMEHSVVDYEPHVALFGGDDGLFFYHSVFDHAREVLNPGGMMAFEMGYDQGERLLTLAREKFPEAECEVLQDLSGKDRMLMVFFPQEN